VPLGLSSQDKRIREFQSLVSAESNNHDWLGMLKAECCRYCSGDVLLELDHDDMLAPNAIQRVREEFADNPDVGFVYSNAIRTTLDLKPVDKYPEGFGWEYRTVTLNGVEVDEVLSFPAIPFNVSRIWYAPDHLRAFRREVYVIVGGHNVNMRVLDDLDLMCRLYSVTKFSHINEGLYIYRCGDNTYAKAEINAEIQNNTLRVAADYMPLLADKWADDNSLRKVELGGRMFARDGYETVDIAGECDIFADLNETWPFADGSVGVIRAMDVFEHLRDTVHVIREVYRVLAPGGYAFIQVPSTDGRGAFQDPTHVSFWNQNSFLYWTHRDWNRYCANINHVRFAEVVPTFTTEKDAYGVCWVRAVLHKPDPDVRIPGPYLI
jgi:hypothetical protein